MQVGKAYDVPVTSTLFSESENKEIYEAQKLARNKIYEEIIKDKNNLSCDALNEIKKLEIYEAALNKKLEIIKRWEKKIDLEKKNVLFFAVRDREAGNIVEVFKSKKEAKKAVEVYEASDKQEGIFEENFYEIYEIWRTELLQLH